MKPHKACEQAAKWSRAKKNISEQSEVKKCGLGKKTGRKACGLCFDGAHLPIIIFCNYPVTNVNKAISPAKLWCFLCWNVLALKTFVCTWVYLLLTCQRSVIWPESDHDTRIWYHGWAASKQSLQAPCLFSPLGHAWLILLADFFYRPTSLGYLFAGCYHISTLVLNRWGLSMSPCITVYGIIRTT